MKKIIVILLLLALAASAVFYWFFFNPTTEEDRIKETLNAMAAACSKKSGESVVGMAMKNSEISNLIADACSVSINEAMVDGTFKPLELAGQISRARTLFSTLSGSVSDIQIELDSDGKTASVEYSVRVFGTRKKNGESFDESRDLRSKLVKIDGKWKFAGVEVIKVLER